MADWNLGKFFGKSFEGHGQCGQTCPWERYDWVANRQMNSFHGRLSGHGIDSVLGRGPDERLTNPEIPVWISERHLWKSRKERKERLEPTA